MNKRVYDLLLFLYFLISGFFTEYTYTMIRNYILNTAELLFQNMSITLLQCKYRLHKKKFSQFFLKSQEYNFICIKLCADPSKLRLRTGKLRQELN